MTVTDVVEETETTDEFASFTEGDREIAYRSEAVPSTALPGGRPAVVAPGAATGRRKEAIARVRLTRGTGEFSVNGRTLGEYFPDKVHQQIIVSPFEAIDAMGQFDVAARLTGGGVSGQAGALRLAIARALNEMNRVAFRGSLKSAGYLSRDARSKERKKYGLKKARKAPQYSKR